MNTPLHDGFGRKINYLRLSVTDRCDLRCSYCMSEKMQFLPREQILSLEECMFVARTFVGLGVDKIRLTGGEPLVRKGIPDLVARLRELEGVRELALTSNGSQLAGFAPALAQAGLHRINISLDSLDAAAYRRITRGGELDRVLAGIDAAIAAFGNARVKLNTVMLWGVNHQELPSLLRFALERRVDISFIEQMPMGETGHSHASSFHSSADAQAQLLQHHQLIPSLESSGGPARYWRIPGRESRVGFISPHTHNFCSSCNRVRVSARGELFTCLGNEGMVDLMPALRAGDEAGLHDLILQALAAKPQEHRFDLSQAQGTIMRFMSRTGG